MSGDREREGASASSERSWPRPPGGSWEPPARLTPFQSSVADVVSSLPPGEVLTYAEVALEAGHPGGAQAVANVLRRVPDLPWWRVVPSSHRLYRTHAPVQAPLLEAEGVTVDRERWIDRDRPPADGRLRGHRAGEEVWFDRGTA